MTFIIGHGRYARATYPVAPSSALSTDEKVKATAADTTPDYLSPKIAAGTNVVKTVLNPGANEQVELAVPSAAPSGPAGGDLAGAYPSPSVVGLTESFGPTDLPIGPIPAGSVLARSGGAIIGVPPVFTPTAHAPTHAPATGTDPLATAAPPVGIGGSNSAGTADSLSRSDHDHTIRETSGPTDLTVGAIAIGQFLRRVAGAIVGASPASSIMFWGNSGVAATTATRYLTPGYEAATAPLVGAIVRLRFPYLTGTLKNLLIRQNVAAGNGNLIVYTVRVNGGASTLFVSMASTANNGSDLVNSVAVVQGDLIDIEVTKALAVGATPTEITATLEVAQT